MDDVYQLTDDEVVKEDGSRKFEDTPFYKEQMAAIAAMANEKPAGAPTPYYWQLVDLARDLCRAAGHDPDLRVLDTQNTQRGPLGSTLVSVTVPAWTLYIEAAENVKGALNG